MYVRHLGEPAPAADKALRDEMMRSCKGVRVVDWLVKGPNSLREYIDYLEHRLAATPRLVEGHRKLRQLADRAAREHRSGGRPPRDFFQTPRFKEERDRILAEYPEITVFPFPDGYAVRSVDEEVAQVRCKLSRARLDFQMWLRSGAPPAGAGFVKMCSPQPGRPLTYWTFEGFAANDDKLNASQLSDIDLIAGGLARGRTREGKPVLTVTGGVAPGEDPNIGLHRARAVAQALSDALRKKRPDLLPFVGFILASEPWCNEVRISIHERNPPPPDLRPHISPDDPRFQPHPMAPTGTPLPKGPGKAPKDPSLKERIRNKVERVLKSHGVKDPTVRRAIADSTVFQGEQGLRSTIGQSGLDFEEQNQAIKEILSRDDQ